MIAFDLPWLASRWRRDQRVPLQDIDALVALAEGEQREIDLAWQQEQALVDGARQEQIDTQAILAACAEVSEQYQRTHAAYLEMCPPAAPKAPPGPSLDELVGGMFDMTGLAFDSSAPPAVDLANPPESNLDFAAAAAAGVDESSAAYVATFTDENGILTRPETDRRQELRDMVAYQREHEYLHAHRQAEADAMWAYGVGQERRLDAAEVRSFPDWADRAAVDEDSLLSQSEFAAKYGLG